MLYLYRRKVSEGARELEDALNDAGTPTRFSQGGLIRERFRPDRDKLICWGDHLADRVGLNNVAPMAKFEEATRLAAAGVRTVEVSRTRPVQGPATRGTYMLVDTGAINEVQGRALLAGLQDWLSRPLPPVAEWLPRRNNHVGGSDLLRPGQADYYSKKEDIREEYRIHVFRGKSIRAGHKVPREGDDAPPVHPWIRSFDGGWRIQYDGFKSTKPMRELAAQATQALGLDFGAVDLGLLASGDLIVLEVNRAPGIEGGSVAAYTGAIQKWLRGED